MGHRITVYPDVEVQSRYLYLIWCVFVVPVRYMLRLASD